MTESLNQGYDFEIHVVRVGQEFTEFFFAEAAKGREKRNSQRTPTAVFRMAFREERAALIFK